VELIEGVVGFLEVGGLGFISYYWRNFNKKNEEIRELKNKIQILELKLELKNEN